MRGLLPPWSSLLKNDYPCSLIRMHLIATSEDSIFQKEDFGWGLLFNVEKTPKTRLFILPTWSNQADMVSSPM